MNEKESKDFEDRYEKHQRTGRPLGDDSFIERLGNVLSRDLRIKKAGRKPKKK